MFGTQLRFAGLEALQDVILTFSATEDSDYAGHSLLEQYQAQISAALRPAFAVDTPPDVTSIACKVASVWISCGAQKHIGDLQRVQDLLATLLATVEQAPHAAYNERASTMLRLSLLTSWAVIYIKSETDEKKEVCFSFNALQRSHSRLLVHQGSSQAASGNGEQVLASCSARLRPC